MTEQIGPYSTGVNTKSRDGEKAGQKRVYFSRCIPCMSKVASMKESSNVVASPTERDTQAPNS